MQNLLYTLSYKENKYESDVRKISTYVVEEEFNKYIKAQYYIQDGELIEDDEAYLISLPKEENKLRRDSEYKRRLPLIVAEKEGEDVYEIGRASCRERGEI